MKKTLLALIAVIFASTATAQELRCKKDTALIKAISMNESKILENGSVTDLIKLYEQQEYAELFNDKHPEKRYLVDEWVSVQDYQQAMLEIIAMFRSGDYKNIDSKLSKPKANFFTQQGELCIFDITYNDQYLNETLKIKNTEIYVRSFSNNQWRVLSYRGTERPVDFREFFPDFPKNIKLKPSMINGLDLADKAYAASISYYKNANMELGDDIQLSLIEKRAETKARLKLNGF